MQHNCTLPAQGYTNRRRSQARVPRIRHSHSLTWSPLSLVTVLGGVRLDSQLCENCPFLIQPSLDQDSDPERGLDFCGDFDYPFFFVDNTVEKKCAAGRHCIQHTQSFTSTSNTTSILAMHAVVSLLAALALLATSADAKAKPRDAILLSKVSP